MIAIDTPKKAAYEFVLNSRAGGAMHEVAVVATLVESVVFTLEKLAALGLAEVAFDIKKISTWEAAPARGLFSLLLLFVRAKRKKVQQTKSFLQPNKTTRRLVDENFCGITLEKEGATAALFDAASDFFTEDGLFFKVAPLRA